MLVVEASRLLFTRVVCGLRGGDSSSSDQDDKVCGWPHSTIIEHVSCSTVSLVPILSYFLDFVEL